MIHLDIKPDLEGVKRGLDDLGLEFEGIAKKVLRRLATIVKKRIKKRMGAFVKDRTGMLRSNIYGRVRSATHAVVAAGYMRVSEPLERGVTIFPKKGKKFLTFQTETGWKRLRSFKIPAKRFFSQSAAGFENEPEYQIAIDKVVNKAVEKAFGKP